MVSVFLGVVCCDFASMHLLSLDLRIEIILSNGKGR